jgi:hypothetical protein
LAVNKDTIITLEVLAVISMVIVLLLQRPGVSTEKYAIRHDQVDFQRRRSDVASATEREFGDSHPVAKLILFRAGGLLLFVGGLTVVLVSSPLTFNPRWIVSILIGLGLAIQLLAVVLFDFWGLALSRQISRNVRSEVPAEDDKSDSW